MLIALFAAEKIIVLKDSKSLACHSLRRATKVDGNFVAI